MSCVYSTISEQQYILTIFYKGVTHYLEFPSVVIPSQLHEDLTRFRVSLSTPRQSSTASKTLLVLTRCRLCSGPAIAALHSVSLKQKATGPLEDADTCACITSTNLSLDLGLWFINAIVMSGHS